ncbi:MAG TPA: extracellular solute-binding protein, partial [Candidatus Acidoferrales bacterium]|nr:extracellular solute-binding protein [Candidatus Acidoferrales bacterium]
FLALLIVLLLSASAPAQTEQEKIEAAKKEGPVYWYGSMNVDDASALLAGLNKKYPFMDIKRYRAANAPVLSKLDVEARARGLNVDVIDLDGFYVAQVLKRNYWIRYVSPELAAYPKELSDPRGLWAGFFLLPQVTIYNTNLVPAASAPRNYNDLLDPKWKNRITIPDSGVTWYHGILQYMGAQKGREFMKRLAAQNVRVQTGNRMMVELTMAGEHAIGIGAYGHRIGQFQRKGAPMGWIKDDVIITTPQAIGISGYGKSPHAAKLIVDFVLSQEGQLILRRSGRVPAHPKVEPDPPELTRGRKIFYSDIVDGGTRYNEINDEFLKVFGGR